MVDEKIFAQVIEGIKKGERSHAKELLTSLLQTDKHNPDHWLWMSSVVDSRKEQIYCLETVLRLDPENEAAKRALIMLGEIDPGDGVVPIPPLRREWVKELGEVSMEEKQKHFPATLGWILKYAGGGIIVLGLILGAIFIPGGHGLFTPKLTVTPITWTPTLSTPSATPSPQPSSTPVPPGEKSLIDNLEATYTSTPIYVDTPHPRYEAYRTAMRAYSEGNYEKMLIFMKQVVDQDNTADAFYHVGESYRLLGRYSEAIKEYAHAIQLNPLFAPSHLGYALAKLAQNPNEKVEDDLTKAIENDPLYGEAFLARAAYWLNWNKPEAALEDAQDAERLLPGSPYPYLYQAKALLTLGKVEEVLPFAKQAQALDVTLVDTYLLLGQAYMAKGNNEKALENLEIYATFGPEEPLEYLIIKGQAYYYGAEYEEAVDLLTEALEYEPDHLDALVYRGLAYIELGEYQKAIVDTFEARELEPEVFQTGLALGKAFFAAEEYSKAKAQFDGQEDRAGDDSQLAQVYYWRALTLEKQQLFFQAYEDWQALLDLPSNAVPEDWRLEAENHLAPTSTPTLTPSPTGTKKPTPSTTPSPAATEEIEE